MLLQLSLMNMPKYARICLNKQDSEYALDPKYDKTVNMAGFSICERYTAFLICPNVPWESSEYNIPVVLTWQYSEYGSVLKMQELHKVLNMPQYDYVQVGREYAWIYQN